MAGVAWADHGAVASPAKACAPHELLLLECRWSHCCRHPLAISNGQGAGKRDRKGGTVADYGRNVDTAFEGYKALQDNIHPHTATGNIREPFCGRESRGKDQMKHLVVRHAGISPDKPISHGFFDNRAPLQPLPVILEHNYHVAVGVVCGEQYRSNALFPPSVCGLREAPNRGLWRCGPYGRVLRRSPPP